MRRLLIVLSLPVMVLAAAACQTGVTMWSACSPVGGNVSGTDGEWVLACRDGRWEPVMTAEEFVAASRGETYDPAPLPSPPDEVPASTTTTTVGPCGSNASKASAATSEPRVHPACQGWGN